MGLSNEQIQQLLKTDKKPPVVKTITTTRYAPVEQFGPLRWHDKPDRCASRGCASQTYCSVKSIPRCMMHALRELNEMLTVDIPGQL